MPGLRRPLYRPAGALSIWAAP
ncbi:MAG: hypothetical protein AVDCRST_MAG05-330, partial [uncultured Rubrobacteraceae bacterium]